VDGFADNRNSLRVVKAVLGEIGGEQYRIDANETNVQFPITVKRACIA